MSKDITTVALVVVTAILFIAIVVSGRKIAELERKTELLGAAVTVLAGRVCPELMGGER